MTNDDGDAQITMTKAELNEKVAKLAEDVAAPAVYSCIALTFDQYASSIETATVDTDSAAARAGAEAALRKAAHEARQMAASMRKLSEDAE